MPFWTHPLCTRTHTLIRSVRDLISETAAKVVCGSREGEGQGLWWCHWYARASNITEDCEGTSLWLAQGIII